MDNKKISKSLNKFNKPNKMIGKIKKIEIGELHQNENHRYYYTIN